MIETTTKTHSHGGGIYLSDGNIHDVEGSDPLRNLGVNIKVQEVEGKAQSDEFFERLQTVEWMFNLRDIPDKFMVKLVDIKFQKYASLLLEHVKKRGLKRGDLRLKHGIQCESYSMINFYHLITHNGLPLLRN